MFLFITKICGNCLYTVENYYELNGNMVLVFLGDYLFWQYYT